MKSHKEAVSYRTVLGQIPDASPGVKNNNNNSNNLFTLEAYNH